MNAQKSATRSRNPLKLELRIFDNPEAALIQKIDDLLIAWNEKTTAIQRKAMVIAAFENDEFIGGIYFRIYKPSVLIDYLAVEEKWRRQGVGTRLLTAAEKEATRHGLGDHLKTGHL